MKKLEESVELIREMVNDGKISDDEIKRIGLSDYRWAKTRDGHKSRWKPRVGDVYQFDFGKNTIPEMSYEHRGLVIGVRKRLIYVLPVFTYIPTKHKDVIRSGEDPGKKNLYLLETSKYTFLKHDSVLKLDDIRTVSIDRIQYKHGRMDIKSEEYETIRFISFKKYFPEYAYEMEKLCVLLKTSEMK